MGGQSLKLKRSEGLQVPDDVSDAPITLMQEDYASVLQKRHNRNIASWFWLIDAH